ncbi:hypothetical protein PG993_000862 [Apiospora rasikravindrae]|uniref:Uncharacterized protein n=1 Tax=Apiospora rasikravindrae TaxID=990691 RepID=A0ABR1U9S9_9PEZI
MILSLGIATCFQQTLRYHTVYTISNDASVPLARHINITDPTMIEVDHMYTMGFISRLAPDPYVALFSPPHTKFTAKAHCGTGNCTWESYETLAICNKCKNISSNLAKNKHSLFNGYTLNNGFGLGTGRALLNMTTSFTRSEGRYSMSRWGSVAFGNNGSQLLSVLVVGASPGTVPEQPPSLSGFPDPMYAPPVAYECLLQVCVHEKRANWTDNTFREVVVASRTNETYNCPEHPCPYAFTITSSKTGTVFYVSEDVLGSTTRWLSGVLVGEAIYNSMYQQPLYWNNIVEPIHKAMNSSATGFTDLMDNLANRLSLSLREIPDQPLAIGQSATALYLAFVRWGWLTLPVFEFVASLLLLVTVMVETRRRSMTAWRNGILAAFFHGFDQRPVVSGGRTSLEEEARQLLVEFRQDYESGGRLVATERQE